MTSLIHKAQSMTLPLLAMGLFVVATVLSAFPREADAGASIRVFDTGSSPARHDYIKFHGRIIPTTPIDPGAEIISVRLTNASGLIYSVDLPAGLIVGNRPFDSKKWKFKDTTAKVLGPGSAHHGVFRMRFKRRQEETGIAYPFFFTAYGDLSAATVPTMTFQIQIGNDVGAVTRTWTGEPGRWKLKEGAF